MTNAEAWNGYNATGMMLDMKMPVKLAFQVANLNAALSPVCQAIAVSMKDRTEAEQLELLSIEVEDVAPKIDRSLVESLSEINPRTVIGLLPFMRDEVIK